MRITICHLYAGGMNIYGDRGNTIALAQRARWRGYDVEVLPIGLGERPNLVGADIIFFGGGQDKEQVLASQDLQGYTGQALIAAAQDGVVMLAVCGGYQLLGHRFRTQSGEDLPGVGILDAHTIAGRRRFIGDVLVELNLDCGTTTLVGFENHSGETYLGPRAKPLGRVIIGSGNNGKDQTEGAVQGNAYGCYLHGALLPKNPWFADHLLLTALRRRYGSSVQMPPLDDSLEEQAHQAVIERIRRRGRVRSAIHSR